MAELSPFHLAIPVNDIEITQKFYTEIIGCSVGRRSKTWIDFNFFGHQVSAHLKPEATEKIQTNPVDGKNVPVRHFGIVLEWDIWHQFVEELNGKSVEYLIEPTVRFKGQVGEQATFFIVDPSGNALEFKSFMNQAQLFKHE
ncbi:MAG: glyoxalase [Proteobacteria bacterium]|nr:glyoxalase [Pseudomonadota bacterium]